MTQPMQPLVVVDGIVRFRPNAIVRRIIDDGLVNLNLVARWCQDPGPSAAIPVEDAEQFWQLLGYSVGAYGDLSIAPEGDTPLVRQITVAMADGEAEFLLHPELRENKPMTTMKAMAVVKFARETWRNDGAEGETVHALCDDVEILRERLDKSVCAWCGHEETRSGPNGFGAMVEHMLECPERKDALSAGLKENLVLRGCLRDLLTVVEAQHHCHSCGKDLPTESHLAGCAAASASAHARLALGDE